MFPARLPRPLLGLVIAAAIVAVVGCGPVDERFELTLGRGTAAGRSWVAVAYPGSVGRGGPCAELRVEGQRSSIVCDIDTASQNVSVFEIDGARVVVAVRGDVDATGATVTTIDGASTHGNVVSDAVFGSARFVAIAVEGMPDVIVWADAQGNELATQPLR